MNKLVVILTGTLLLMGCEAISSLLPKDKLPQGTTSADLVIHADGVSYKYTCQVDATTKTLTNCTEVQ
mgnify:CR=1 FL=1